MFLGRFLMTPAGPLIGLFLGLTLAVLVARSSPRPEPSTSVDTETLREALRRMMDSHASGRDNAVRAVFGLGCALGQRLPDAHRDIVVRTLAQFGQAAGPGSPSVQELRNTIREKRFAETDVDRMCEVIREFGSDRLIENTLRMLYVVRFSVGGEQDRSGEEFVRHVADKLGVPDSRLESIRRRIRQAASRNRGTGGRRGRSGGADPGTRRETESSLKEDYGLLDLERGASLEEVKEAYREKARRYHPDQFSEDQEAARELAEEKMMELNAAYRRLKDHLEE